MNEKPDWQQAFIKRLRALDPPDDPDKTDRATLAHLRRGLGKPGVETLCRVGNVFDAVPDWATEDAILVAGLFAEHSAAGGSGSLGSALRVYRDKTGAEESTDRRFIQVVDSEKRDLSSRLRHIVKLLASKDVPINWYELLKHMLNWDGEERPVQWQWSRDYWRAAREDLEANEETQTETPAISNH
jgi:CRISPR type I-E-associated protein CasB/Cse2